MKLLFSLITIFLSTSIFSQGKVTLGPTPINQELPLDLTNRIFWKQTDLFKFNIDQLAGSIIYSEDTANNFLRGPRIIDLKSPLQIKTVESGVRFHSKVDNGWNTDLKFLIFTSAISSDQVVDIKITDLLYVFMNYDKIPVDSIVKAAKGIKGNGKKYYIQGALLTSIDQVYSSKVSGNSSLVGSVFGANGKVYNETQKSSQDFRISLTLIDIDKLSFFVSSNSFNNTDNLQTIINSSLVEALRKPILIKGFK